MDFEDFFEPEVGIAAVVAAAIFSPRARKVLRRGLVYGTAGVLIAGDAITSFTKNVGQNIQQMHATSQQQETMTTTSPESEKAKEKVTR